MSAVPQIVPVAARHREGWGRLFAAYCASGGIEATQHHLDRVWGWLLSPEAQTRGWVALVGDDVVGLVHFRPFERPITGTTGLWLDDLYVDPSQRGRGVARELVDHVRRVARGEERDVVRWTTKETNSVARHLYDQIAVRAPVVVYNATP